MIVPALPGSEPHSAIILGSKNLESFTFTEISDDAPGVSEIQVDLVYEDDGKKVKGVR